MSMSFCQQFTPDQGKSPNRERASKTGGMTTSTSKPRSRNRRGDDRNLAMKGRIKRAGLSHLSGKKRIEVDARKARIVATATFQGTSRVEAVHEDNPLSHFTTRLGP